VRANDEYVGERASHKLEHLTGLVMLPVQVQSWRAHQEEQQPHTGMDVSLFYLRPAPERGRYSAERVGTGLGVSPIDSRSAAMTGQVHIQRTPRPNELPSRAATAHATPSIAWLALQRSPGGVEHTPPTHKYCIACDLHGSYRDKLLEVVPEKRVQFIQFKRQSKAKVITFPQTCHQTCRRYKKKTSSQVPRDLQLQRTTKDTRALYSPAPNILIV
jgi:hypothetical protein